MEILCATVAAFDRMPESAGGGSYEQRRRRRRQRSAALASAAERGEAICGEDV
jgi:hypothetical protein